ncbi:MAG: outer membrane protein assembly factor BamA [Nitrospinota bacterium]|nr:outer membrane protein assembly factor BamA [Nitrospinota bacterium]
MACSSIGGWCALASFWRRRLVACALILLFGLIPAQMCAQEEGVTVSAIRIQGNKRVDSSTIFYYIKTEVGKPLSRALVRKDIQQIYSLGQFTDIRVDTQAAQGGGVEVTFVVQEIPSVGEVTFKGNDALDTADLRDVISIKRGVTFKEHLVKDAIQKLTAHYHDKAFFLAKVDVDTQVNEEGLMDVIIRIDEGKKIRIDEISFTGNKAFDEDDLEDAMETGEEWLFSFLDESGIYKKDVLKLDVLRLEAFYQERGFIRVRIQEPNIVVNREDEAINIEIKIEEGQQYQFGKIDANEIGEFSKEDLLKDLKSKTGETYNVSLLREDVLTITEKFSEKGFAYADVNPRADIDDEKRVVNLNIQIDPGHKVYVGKINVIGNTRTRDNVVRREFRLKEGELFNSKKLKRSKQRINNLGYFEDVKIDTHRGDTPGQIDIDTTVTERPTGSISFGAGFSSVDKVIFNASIAQDNVLGTGRQANISANISARRTNFNIQLTEPRIFDSDVSAGIDVFNNRSNYFSFDTRSQGGGLRFGKNLSETDWAGLNYRFSRVKISDVINPTPLLKNETRTTSRIGTTFINDSRDNFINPTQGWRHVVRLEFAGSFLGGADFYKTGYEITYYRKLIGKLVGAVHGEINYAEGYSGEELPAFERYFMGGPNSLRGFTIRQVGPMTNIGDPLGGEQSLLFNVELQYPITQGFRVFSFYDRGNVYGEGNNIASTDTRINLSKMRESVGGGIRFFSPFGPISLAYGVKLDRRTGESAGEFHFSAGNAF